MALSRYGSFTGYRMQPNGGAQCTSCICRCVWVKKNREHKEIFETLPCERNGANRSASTSAFPAVRPGLLSRSLPPYTFLFPLPQAHAALHSPASAPCSFGVSDADALPGFQFCRIWNVFVFCAATPGLFSFSISSREQTFLPQRFIAPYGGTKIAGDKNYGKSIFNGKKI